MQISIDEFLLTKKFVKDLSKTVNYDEHINIQAFIYLDSYYIYDKTKNYDKYLLILGNEQFSAYNIRNLEERLYNFCKEVGAI